VSDRLAPGCVGQDGGRRASNAVGRAGATSLGYRLAVYAILLVSAAIYLPSVDGLALWDDRALIGAYRSLQQCFEAPFLQHYFRPVVAVTFYVEFKLWGRDALLYHRDNILIHVATTAALIGLLRTLFRDVRTALLGGLLFAVQPAQASTVAWIGGRTDSLCTLLATLFLWTLALAARSQPGVPPRREPRVTDNDSCMKSKDGESTNSGPRGTSAGALVSVPSGFSPASWGWTALSAVLFLLAALTKEQALALLPIVPAAHLLLHHRGSEPHYGEMQYASPLPKTSSGAPSEPAGSIHEPESAALTPREPGADGRYRPTADDGSRFAAAPLHDAVGRKYALRAPGISRGWLAAARTAPFVAAALLLIALWVRYYPEPRLPQVVPAADSALLAGHAACYYALLFLAPAPRWLHTLTLTAFDPSGWPSAAAGLALLAGLAALAARLRRSNPAVALLLLFALLGYLPVSDLVPMPSLYAAPYRVGLLGPAVAGLIAAAIVRLAARSGLFSLPSWVRSIARRSAQAPSRTPAGTTGDGRRPGARARAVADGIAPRIAGRLAASGESAGPRMTAGSRRGSIRVRGPAAALIAMAPVVWSGAITMGDNTCWLSQERLFAAFHRDDPGNIPTTCQYSRELIAARRPREAVQILERMLDGLFGDRAWAVPESAARSLATDPALVRRLRLQYGSADTPARRLAGILADLAAARRAAGDEAGAGVALRSALAVERGNPYANFVAAKMAFTRGDARRALLSMRISLAAQSERYESHALMLRILLSMRRWREVEGECQACLGFEPWREETYRQLAYARSELGDRPGAEQALRAGLRESEGDHIELRAALTTLRRVARQ